MNKELADQIHKMIKSMWKKDKAGYCWLKEHFQDTRMTFLSEPVLRNMLHCLFSKRDGFMCLVHRRTHEKIK